MAAKIKGRQGYCAQRVKIGVRKGKYSFHQDERVVVRGVNIIKKHQRQTQTEQGGIISKEASIHVSNVA